MLLLWKAPLEHNERMVKDSRCNTIQPSYCSYGESSVGIRYPLAWNKIGGHSLAQDHYGGCM